MHYALRPGPSSRARRSVSDILRRLQDGLREAMIRSDAGRCGGRQRRSHRRCGQPLGQSSMLRLSHAWAAGSCHALRSWHRASRRLFAAPLSLRGAPEKSRAMTRPQALRQGRPRCFRAPSARRLASECLSHAIADFSRVLGGVIVGYSWGFDGRSCILRGSRGYGGEQCVVWRQTLPGHACCSRPGGLAQAEIRAIVREAPAKPVGTEPWRDMDRHVSLELIHGDAQEP